MRRRVVPEEHPELGDKRIRSRFLWGSVTLPVKEGASDLEKRWLTKTTWIERYETYYRPGDGGLEDSCGGGRMVDGWIPRYWAD